MDWGLGEREEEGGGSRSVGGLSEGLRVGQRAREPCIHRRTPPHTLRPGDCACALLGQDPDRGRGGGAGCVWGHRKLPRDGDSGLSLAGVHHGEKAEEGCPGRRHGPSGM